MGGGLRHRKVMDDGFLSLKSYLEMEPNGRGTVSLKVMNEGEQCVSNYRSFCKGQW